ncbi:MAG: hypothetical protein EPO21_20345 [Chloroflexota bacterium]|nr:MAG: hypothetical protein EPO21_20345 [Chloroflexota bacterium]
MNLWVVHQRTPLGGRDEPVARKGLSYAVGVDRSFNRQTHGWLMLRALDEERSWREYGSPGGNEAMNEVSVAQAEAIREIMRIIVDDDLAKGISPGDSAVCDHCRQIKPAPGFIMYDQYKLCNDCSCEYELARVQGRVHSPRQFMRRAPKFASGSPSS